MHKSMAGFVVAVISCFGCGGPSFQTRVPDAAITPTRMIVLPAVVKTYELDATDSRAEHRDENLDSNIAAAVRTQATGRGLRLFTRELDAQELAVKSLYARLWRWIPKASMEIAAQQTGRRDSGRHSVGDWRFPGDLSPLGAALQADTALTVFVSDTRETTGRSVALALGGGSTYWKRVGVACVISLRDGRPLACDSRVDAWGDLNNPGVATAAVSELFDGLLPARASGDGKAAGRPNL
jgi:hypothetical protein